MSELTLLIVTSHRPTMRIRTLSHDLRRVLIGSHRINRGKLNLDGVVERALSLGADRLMFLERWKGAPGKIELYRLGPGLQRVFPVIYLSSVQLQDELQGPYSTGKRLVAVISEDAPPELLRLSKALTDFLEIPLVMREDEVENSSTIMVLESRGLEVTVTFKRPKGLEVGPRLRLRNLIWSDRGS